MEKKTMGSFMAALRKANGLTQQEVADRLNVSNKAVSRWERDECAPDISLIPVIAELYGVTCDELLKGERIFNQESTRGAEIKAEKQLKALANRSLSHFKMMILISMAVTAVGLICMFGISYGFYRPEIGFAVGLIFDVAAVVTAVLALVKLQQIRTDNDLMQSAGASLLARYYRDMGAYSYAAFFAVFASVVLSLPLVCLKSEYVKSVLYIGTYFASFFIPIAVALVCLFLLMKPPYIKLLSGGNAEPSADKKEKRMIKLDIIQFVTAFAGYALLFNSEVILKYCGLIVMLCGVIYFSAAVIRFKDIRKSVLFFGIRNLLLTADLLFVFCYCRNIYYITEIGGSTATVVEWNRYAVFLAVVAAIVIFTVFRQLAVYSRKKQSASASDI